MVEFREQKVMRLESKDVHIMHVASWTCAGDQGMSQ